MAQAAFISGEIENLVADIYRDNKEAKGKEILDLVNDDTRMNGRKISLSTVQTLLAKWHKQERAMIAAGIPTNPLDRPWTMGLSMAYGIPSDIVPSLVKLKIALNNRLTIRISRWFAYLYPTLWPQVSEQYKDKYPDLLPKLGIIYEISKQYARKEATGEILTGKISPLIQAPDTTDIDNTYFINADISENSIWDKFFDIFLPESSKQCAIDKKVGESK